jgi:hypothetical protein
MVFGDGGSSLPGLPDIDSESNLNPGDGSGSLFPSHHRDHHHHASLRVPGAVDPESVQPWTARVPCRPGGLPVNTSLGLPVSAAGDPAPEPEGPPLRLRQDLDSHVQIFVPSVRSVPIVSTVSTAMVVDHTMGTGSDKAGTLKPTRMGSKGPLAPRATRASRAMATAARGSASHKVSCCADSDSDADDAASDGVALVVDPAASWGLPPLACSPGDPTGVPVLSQPHTVVAQVVMEAQWPMSPASRAAALETICRHLEHLCNAPLTPQCAAWVWCSRAATVTAVRRVGPDSKLEPGSVGPGSAFRPGPAGTHSGTGRATGLGVAGVGSGASTGAGNGMLRVQEDLELAVVVPPAVAHLLASATGITGFKFPTGRPKDESASEGAPSRVQVHSDLGRLGQLARAGLGAGDPDNPSGLAAAPAPTVRGPGEVQALASAAGPSSDRARRCPARSDSEPESRSCPRSPGSQCSPCFCSTFGLPRRHLYSSTGSGSGGACGHSAPEAEDTGCHGHRGRGGHHGDLKAGSTVTEH